MATLSKLTTDGILTAIEVETDDLPWRYVFGIHTFVPWLSNTLPAMATRVIGGDSTPEEQVYDLLEQFVIGAPMIIDRMFKLMHPQANGVWELRKPDIRIFGWFPCKDHFIAVAGEDASRLHDNRGMHTAYAREVVRIRDQLDIDPPKFVPGGNPNDVISIRT